MNKIIRILLFLFLTICIRNIYAQENLIFNGYVSSLQQATFQKFNDAWLTENLIHNRLNFKYNINEKLSSGLEIRNRLFFGEQTSLNSNAASAYDEDFGLVDLSKNLTKGRSYILNSSIDRGWLSYEAGKLKVTAGRQRINWGQTLVWNPNDIFNAYSFFDFDYIERPGSDALRLQYYNSEVSSAELAMKLDSRKKLTAAALYRTNRYEYDVQFLGGVLSGEDMVAGLGWSGAIKSLSLRGEVSYCHPIKSMADTSGIFLASISADYTFSNSLYVMAEYLFSSNTAPEASFLSFYNAPKNVKNITFVKHNIVGQVSYPLTPLISTSLSLMYLPGVKGYYLGPSVSYNLAENVDASLFYQGFHAEIESFNETFRLVFLRVKWSF